MLNEEKMLLEKYGRKSTFRVPEGYFDHFADTMASRMLEGASASKARVRFPIWHYSRSVILTAAASICFAVFGVSVYSHYKNVEHAEKASAINIKFDGSHNDSFDAAVDYVMMDSEDMYASLADSK